jgi:Uma2 family endonuclease
LRRLGGRDAAGYAESGGPVVERARPFTVQDYMALDDDRPCQVVAGVLHVSPAPTSRHQRCVVTLVRLLDGFVVARRLGLVFVAPTDVVLSELDVVQPDVLFVSEARRHLARRRGIEGAPDLVVEVLSPSTEALDRRGKLSAYAVAGVAEHWLVDLDEARVEVRRGPGLPLHETVRSGGQVTTPLLPGLTLAVDALVPPELPE